MLWTLLLVLLILWLWGLVVGAGGWIHVLPLVMAALLLYRMVAARRP